MSKFYLLLYNVILWVGNVLAVASIVRYNVEYGLMKGVPWTSLPIDGSFAVAAPFVKVILLASVLEVVHTLVGLSKGNPVASLVQVGFKSLVFFFFMAHSSVPREVTSSQVAGLLLFTWTIADSIRYPFYIQAILGSNIWLITWLRYSAWIVLYPVGILAEAVVIYSNLADIKKTGRYSFPLPNILNMSFDPVSAIYLYLFGFLFVGSYFMLRYMWHQRTRVMSKSIKVN